jgi:hypothetical protein
MARKKPFIPFKMLPASWGLKGKSRQIAEAEYYLDGEELEYQLCEIQHASDPYELDIQRNDLDFKFNKITDFEHAHEKISIDHGHKKITDEQFEIAILDLRLEHERISQSDYEKALAGIKKEPFVNVLSMGVDKQNVSQGYIELDWNDEFIKLLHEAGYSGTSDEDIVNKWFNGVCRTVLLQSAADLDYGLAQTQINQQQERSDVIRRFGTGQQSKTKPGSNGSSDSEGN